MPIYWFFLKYYSLLIQWIKYILGNLELFGAKSNFIDNKTLFLLKFSFVSVCNTNANNFLENKNDVMSDNIVHEKCPLIAKV